NGFFNGFNPFVAPSIFYGRGVLKSTDGGATWSLKGSNLFDRRSISRIVVDPTNPTVVYAAVGQPGTSGLAAGQGTFKSTDGGTTWANTTTSISTNDAYTDVVIDPSNPQVLYAAVGTDVIDPNTFNSSGTPANGVYKTTNGGQSWA